MRLVHLIVIFVGSIIMYSCSGTDSSNVDTTDILDSLKTKYVAIEDSLDSAWTRMIYEDDLKLGYLKRLVDEVTYTGEFEQAKVDEYYQKIENTRNLRYDRQTMADSELINEYDFAIKTLITEVTTFASSHPKYDKYPLMEELINDIRALDHNTLFMRLNYDHYAKEYNRFIEDNKEQEVEITTEGFNKKPLFELSE